VLLSFLKLNFLFSEQIVRCYYGHAASTVTDLLNEQSRQEK